MLLNEFLKEHKKVQEQQGKIENQQATIAELKSRFRKSKKGWRFSRPRLKSRPRKLRK
jgi:hypothetical protein